MNKMKKLIIILLTSFLGMTLFQSLLTSLAQTKADSKKVLDDNTVVRTCYRAAVPQKTPVQSVHDLENKLQILEKQYKEKKIDEKTYKQSKENILNQIEKLK